MVSNLLIKVPRIFIIADKQMKCEMQDDIYCGGDQRKLKKQQAYSWDDIKGLASACQVKLHTKSRAKNPSHSKDKAKICREIRARAHGHVPQSWSQYHDAEKSPAWAPSFGDFASQLGLNSNFGTPMSVTEGTTDYVPHIINN